MSESAGRLATALAERYTIERELGQGGMATVYLAHDLKHDRQVAIKVLRPELAAVLGAERFVQEIKTTANLQHPHILPLYDSGRAGAREGGSPEFLYYVMPYIEGETLREKLNRETQLGIEEAVTIAIEVADALEYAHRQGVIHRDIKPENILLHNGRPMVSDFGIALAVTAAAGERMTETGLSLGTPHYMSPEQATAQKDLTNRSDIYSLGAVLYEMLAGEPPHTGPTAQAVVGSIVSAAPDAVENRRPTTPAHVADAVHVALERLPADRFPSADSFAGALRDSSAGTPSRRTTRTAGRDKPTLPRRAAIAGALLLTLGVGGLSGWFLRTAPAIIDRLEIHFPEDQQLVSFGGGYPTVYELADGSGIVYGGIDGSGANRLFVRRYGSGAAEAIPGAFGANARAWAVPSPDGTRLGLLTVPDLRTLVMPVDGGVPALVTDSLWALLSWGPDGKIYGVHGIAQVAARVSPDGGVVERLAAPDTTGATAHWMPEPLPDGNGVLVTIIQDPDRHADAHVAVIDVATGAVKQLTQGFGARYARSGYVVFARTDGSLYAAPFDPGRLALTGEPTQVVRDVAISSTVFFASFSISQGGSLVYTPASQSARREALAWTDRAGRELAATAELPSARGPRFSPDGARVAFQGLWHILLAHDAARPPRSLTGVGNFAAWHTRPTWRDDRTVTMTTLARGGARSFSSVSVDGVLTVGETGLPKVLSAVERPGGGLVMVAEEPTRSTIAFADRGEDTPQVFSDARADEHSPALSPDGRWLAYVSNDDVWIAAFPGKGDRTQLSTGGGAEPRWARNGTELFYRAGDSLYVADVATTPSLDAGNPRALFSVDRYVSGLRAANYDVSSDGQRFVFVKQLGSRPHYVVVERRWVDKLPDWVAR